MQPETTSQPKGRVKVRAFTVRRVLRVFFMWASGFAAAYSIGNEPSWSFLLASLLLYAASMNLMDVPPEVQAARREAAQAAADVPQ